MSHVTVKNAFRNSKKVNPNNINSEHSSIDPNFKIFLCQLNNLSEEESSDNENLPHCKYRDVSYFANLDMKFKMAFFFFHLNIN